MIRRFPGEALLAITYRCNARCSMCNTWQHPSVPQEEIRPCDLESLPSFSFCNITGGEPFIREDIEDFARVMLNKAKRVVISTNGYFTEKIVALFEKYPSLGIRVSLEGLPETNNRLRGLSDGFDRGLRTILQLQKLGVKDIGFGITLSDQNINDLMELYQLGKSMDMEFATACAHNSYYFHKFDNQVKRLDDFHNQLKKLIIDLLKSRKIKNWFRGYFNYGLLNYARGGKRILPCEAVKSVVFIDPLANLMPCNGMDSPLGNLKKEAFADIWNRENEKFVTLVENCRKECWMIGTASPAMKRNPVKPILWVARQKIKLALNKELDLTC